MPFLPEDPERERKLLELMSDFTERGVRKALRAYSHKVALIFVIVITLSAGLFYLAFTQAGDARNNLRQSGVAVAVEGCNRDFVSTQKIRTLLITLKERNIQEYRKAEEEGRVTVDVLEEYNTADDFYEDQLAAIRLPDCRQVAAAFNVDPEKVTSPKPLYPSDSELRAQG